MSTPSPSEISRILLQLEADGIDHREAADRIFEVAYAELHRLASLLMRGERTDHTLQPTALIHEAYARLVKAPDIHWKSRAHFFGIAARAMRRVLVDHARQKLAAKREGRWEKVTLEQELVPGATPDIDLLRLEESLTRLAGMDERVARIAELRVFAGMKIDEIAHVLGISRRTAYRDWKVGRAWLTAELAEGNPAS